MSTPPASNPSATVSRRGFRGSSVGLSGLTFALCCAHGWFVWTSMGGWAGMTSGWPPWRDDHPLYFHSALVTRHFLAQNGTTAGYDPAFMAGYPKSVIFPASSTLPELAIALTGGKNPVEVYKVYVLASAALIPWLIWASASLWRAGPGGGCAAVLLFLLYVWTDYPMRYAEFGMLPYLLAIPFGLAATGVFCHYVEKGGVAWWLASSLLMAAMVLVHFTSAFIVAPASAAVYLASIRGTTFPRSRHVGVWAIPLAVLALNAFWWAPGVWLAGTKGKSDFAFMHDEGFLQRLWQIGFTEPAIERVLCALGLAGLLMLGLAGQPRARKVGLATFVLMGFLWGYASAMFRSLDFLQPGRHTYAFYSGLAVASGFGLSEALGWVKARSRWRLDLVFALGLISVGVWFFGPIVSESLTYRVFAKFPPLECRPSPWLLWVSRNVKKYVKPGERLLYEEGGKDVPGVPDPFQGGRFSGLLADRYGIELIGGPYLYASLTANFTQFGEDKLFGVANWDRDRFVRYARLYRPAAILCWTPHSLAFCRANPDLIEIKEDEGHVLIGRVRGFEGAAVVGKARVEAGAGVLRVTALEPGVDGTVVLRYHSVPCLRSSPPDAWESVYLEDDPVPFIKLRPTAGAVSFGLRFPPGRGER